MLHESRHGKWLTTPRARWDVAWDMRWSESMRSNSEATSAMSGGVSQHPAKARAKRTTFSLAAAPTPRRGTCQAVLRLSPRCFQANSPPVSFMPPGCAGIYPASLLTVHWRALVSSGSPFVHGEPNHVVATSMTHSPHLAAHTIADVQSFHRYSRHLGLLLS